MSQTTVQPATGARTGRQYLDGLGAGAREIWLNGEKVTHPLEHPQLRGGALSLARVFDIQHEHADEMLAPSPDDPALRVNVTHLIPRTARRPRAPPARIRAGRGELGRDHGPHARLPQRHLRLLRGPRRRVGAPRQRAGRRRTSSPTSG